MHDVATRGERLLDAIEAHAAQLSLPEGRARPADVIEPDVQR